MGRSAHPGCEGRSVTTGADLRAALEFVHDISTARDPDEFAVTATEGLFRLIRCDRSTFSVINLAQGRSLTVTVPAGASRPDTDEAFSRDIAERLPVAHDAAGEAGAPTTFDLLTWRRFHATRLYDELFTPVEGEYLLSTALPLPEPIVAGWSLVRSSRDFSARDRLLLDLLAPHLSDAYDGSLLRAALAVARKARPGRLSFVMLGMDGEPLYAEPEAAAALRAHFGDELRGGALPSAVHGWLTLGSRRPLLLVRDGRRLRIDAVGRRPAALLVTDRSADAPVERLRELGLTRREAEVLALVVEGPTNSEIAATLAISAGTVKRHLESIYAKLGVHTRTAAAAAAMDSGVSPARDRRMPAGLP